MNAPPFPIQPQVGEWFQNWVWNGARWVASPTTGMRVLTQVFTATGPYMPSPGLVSCIVECIGGGGGGGAVSADLVATLVVGGAGGGSGGYSRRTLPAALVRGGVLVTVGDGGASNTQGGTTSFGALCVANGGFGAGNIVQFAGISPGEGAQPGIGDVAMQGATGASGTYFDMVTSGVNMALVSAKGGELWGGANIGEGGPGVSSAGPDASGNSGAGGAGAIVNQNAAAGLQLGGNGGSGICIVTEFCWGDRDQPFSEVPTFNLNANLVMGPPQPGCGPMPPRPPGPWPREWESWEDPNAISDS